MDKIRRLLSGASNNGPSANEKPPAADRKSAPVFTIIYPYSTYLAPYRDISPKP